MTLIALVLVVGAGFGGIYAYRSLLPPRYQEQMITEVPFMRAFLPPTPPGGSLPTVAPREGGISPEDLLALPLGDHLMRPTDAATVRTYNADCVSADGDADPVRDADQPPAHRRADRSADAGQRRRHVQSMPSSRPLATRMYGFTWIRETWNNCGPANITMALSHYGWRETQEYAASFLKPNPEDKNVSPRRWSISCASRPKSAPSPASAGTWNLLKDFIAANIPVIIETGYSLEGENWLGHYQTIVGYDDNQSSFLHLR